MSSPVSSIACLDATFCLPEALFRKQLEAGCTIFMQDAKFDFRQLERLPDSAMKTCELSPLLSAWWDKADSEQASNLPLATVITLMKEEKNGSEIRQIAKTLAEHLTKNGSDVDWIKVSQEVKQVGMSLLLPTSLEFPPSDKESSFSLKQLNTPCAADADSPRREMLDNEPLGSVNPLLGYKHLSRLALNGTKGATQNPNYVLVEAVYKPTLAAFLKERFAADRRLVLKHVACSKDEGVVMINASTVERLDAALSLHLKEDSPFKRASPLAICLVESLIATAEPAFIAEEENKLVETMVRVAYFALFQQGTLQLQAIGGAKATADPLTQLIVDVTGLVKLPKWPVEKMTALSAADLEKMEPLIHSQISVIAERALRYDAKAAVQYFLQSANPLLNLVGVELFYPFHSGNYRESTCEGLFRISNEQCQLFSALLERNKNPLLVSRLLQHLLFDVLQIPKGLKIASALPALFQHIWQENLSDMLIAELQHDFQYIRLHLEFQEETAAKASAQPLISQDDAIPAEFSIEAFVKQLEELT